LAEYAEDGGLQATKGEKQRHLEAVFVKEVT
jgi:hypothetical protein